VNLGDWGIGCLAAHGHPDAVQHVGHRVLLLSTDGDPGHSGLRTCGQMVFSTGLPTGWDCGIAGLESGFLC
jgi:hypothetical protein